MVTVESSTVARAGEAATRLAVEETLVRRGWRVLFFDDQSGALFGPQRPRLFDGIAVRLQAGAPERVEIRLLHMESDTLDAPGELLERVKRAARAASLEWLVVAFDGEAMRVIPALNEIEAAAVHPSSPSPSEPVAPRPESASQVPASRRSSQSPSIRIPAAKEEVGSARDRRRPARGRPAQVSSAGPGARPSGRVAKEVDSRDGKGRRGGPATARSGGPATTSGKERESSSPQSAQQASGSPATGRRSRRRGKRGGRRRSGRSPAS